MLQVSQSAVSMLQEARAAQEVPDTFGLRVFAQASQDGEPVLTLAFAEEPLEGDEVIEQGGTEIYVSNELVGPLGDSILDVTDTAQGPQFTLVPQGDEEQ